MSRRLQFLFLCAVAGFGSLLLTAIPAYGGWKDDIGHTSLAAEIGPSLATGTNITVSHIEAPDGSGFYLPDSSNTQFSGKTFTNVSGSSTGISSHATTVGLYYYGTLTGISPDINTIDNYEASNWLGSGGLRTGLTQDPVAETRRLQSHSWIGNHGNRENVLRRFDFAIARDGFTAIVGLNNAPPSNAIPELLAHSYNTITVGCSDGGHSTGTTTFDVAGRTKPDLVVPFSFVSWSAPVVAGAAAMLMEWADTTPAWTNASKPQSIKAILLAGATKDKFPSWDRTPSRPLDNVYGAGELNIYNSYHILAGGEQKSNPTSLVQRLGWDFDSIVASNSLLYDGRVGTDFPPEVANMTMRLHATTNFILVDLMDASTSRVDNVEHIYQKHLS